MHVRSPRLGAVNALRNLGLAAGAGLVLTLAFPDRGWWPAAILALALLWWALERASAWGGFFRGWAFGIAFLLPHVWWAHEAVGAIPWAALALAEGVAFGLFGAAWAHVRRSGMLGSRWLEAPVFALLWVGMEELRSVVPFGGFPWGRVGFAMVDSPLARLAWLGGAPAVALATVLAGALLGFAFEAMRGRRPLAVAVAPVVAIGVVVVGLVVPLSSQATDGTMRLGIVQGNVPNDGLDSFAQARLVTENHLAGTHALMDTDPGEVDLLVWPENAADIDPRVDAQTAADVTEAARTAGAPLLFGTIDYSPADGRYNTSLLWSQSGTVLAEYRKQRPAPFAEYIPIRSFARIFSADVDRVTADVLPGEGPAVMDVPVKALGRAVTIGTVICFEVVYDDIVRQAVTNGGEAIIVQTNNATFGLTSESTQQLAMTRLRAIEFGRATVQASTVGVSAVVTPTGRVVQSTELFTADQMYATVPLRTDLTPAARIGTPLHWTFLAVSGLLVFFAMRRRVADRYEW